MEAALDALSDSSTPDACVQCESALDGLSSCASAESLCCGLDSALDDLSDASSKSESAIVPFAIVPIAVGDPTDSDGPLCTPDPEPIVFDHPLEQVAWLARCSPDHVLDEADVELVKFFTTMEGPTSNDSSVALIVGQGGRVPISRRWLGYNRASTASAALKLERIAWEKLETKVVESCDASHGMCKAFIYMEATAYDGVDILVRSKAPAVLPQGAAICDNTAADAVSASPLVDQRDDGRCKILQSECHNIMAFTKGDLCNIIVGSQLMSLQKSDRTTGECMGALLKDHSIGIPGHPNFARRIRNVCTDRYVPNYLGESVLQQVPARIGFETIHIPCHAHIGSSGLTVASSVCRSVIVPMKGYIGSVRSPGEMQKFRNAGQAWLWKHLECVEACSPAVTLSDDAKAFRTFVLDILMPHDVAHSRYLRFVITSCAPGDWRRLDKFIFLMQPGTSKDSAFKFIVQHLFSALFGHMPWKLPDGKWTGSDNTFRDIGVPASIHGMLAGVWREYMVLYHKGEVPAEVKRTWTVGPPLALPWFVHGSISLQLIYSKTIETHAHN
jgi:hypothetical protein